MSNTGLPYHPLCMKFELLTGAEFDRLVADIRTNGLHEPITMYEGQILDGKNRYRACLTAKVAPKFDTFSGTEAEAAAYAESANFHRRHMKPSQKRAHAEELLKANPEKSDRQIAEMAKVSKNTAAAVRQKMEATGQIDQLKKRVGADGKSRKQPAKHAKRTPDDADIKAKQSNQPKSAGSSQPAVKTSATDEIAMRTLTNLIAHCLRADPIKTAQALRKEHAAESIDKLAGWLDQFMVELKQAKPSVH
jgi:ParB-like chromosome segregation protein Spo0J